MFMNNFVKIILLDLIHMIFLEAVRNHVFKKICRDFGSFRFEIHFFFRGGGMIHWRHCKCRNCSKWDFPGK